MSVKKIKLPPTAVNPPDKLEYAYSAQEKLRLVHNQKGKDFKDKKITQAEWELWKSEYFDPRSILISSLICAQKEALKKSVKYPVDLDNDFEE